MMLLVSSNKYLNAQVYYDIHLLENWIGREAVSKEILTDAPEYQKNKVARQALKEFRKDLDSGMKLLESRPLMGRIRPMMFCLSGFQFLHLFLKGFLDSYFLDCPEDLEIQEKWRTFCHDFAHLRYRRDKAVSDRVHEFFIYLRAKLEVQSADKDQSSHLEVIKIFEELIKINSDLIDINLAQLSRLGISKSFGLIEVSIEVVHLQHAYYLMVRELKANLVWLVKYAEEKITPHLATLDLATPSLDSPETFGQKLRKAFLTLKELISQMDTLQAESIEDILNKCPRIQQFIGEFSIFGAQQPFGDHKPIIQEMEKEGANPGRTEVEKESCKSLVTAFTDVNDCHILMHSYLYEFGLAIEGFAAHLKKWSQGLKANKQFAKSKKNAYQQLLRSLPRVIDVAHLLTPADTQMRMIPSSSKSGIGSLARPKFEDLDSALAFIEGKKSKRSKNSRRKNMSSSPKQSLVKAAPAVSAMLLPISEEVIQIAEALPGSSVEFSSCSTSQSVSITREEQLLWTLIQQVQGQGPSHLRTCLRQVVFALNSLITFYEKVRKNDTASLKSYHYHMGVSKMYYLIEQVLRFKKIESDPASGELNHHNLRRLKELGLIDNPAAQIVKKLHSANLWVLYTENQMTSRKLIHIMNERSHEFIVPGVLSNLYKISHNPSSELSVKLKDELNSIYIQTLAFVELLLPAVEEPLVPLASKSCKALSNQTFNPATIRGHQEKLHSIIILSEKLLTHEATDRLREGRKSLGFLKRILKEIDSGSLTLKEFSLYLRDAIYLTNHVCESILMTLLAKKHNVETREHNLEKLVESCLENSSIEIQEFFNLHFRGINTDSRYPFDVEEVRSTLHRLILEAEFLCERDELEEGFQMSAGETLTPLNFIKLPKTAFTTSEIWAEASKILSSALGIVFQEALPQLEGLLGDNRGACSSST